ncbi:MAG: hypothetical protein HC772_20760, partial [Leptolyngbyaceae cyanobacterium CRU_2_3]|nr:hypothetical protein [Leptolyngbyaceae cyanobacterium CRU_2_3]
FARRNPRLVYSATSGFGQTGPDRERPALEPRVLDLNIPFVHLEESLYLLSIKLRLRIVYPCVLPGITQEY